MSDPEKLALLMLYNQKTGNMKNETDVVCTCGKLTAKRKREIIRTMTDELDFAMAKLDWIKILDRAIKSRSTSWGADVVREWRNAGDTLWSSVIQAMRDAKIINDPWKQSSNNLPPEGGWN